MISETRECIELLIELNAKLKHMQAQISHIQETLIRIGGKPYNPSQLQREAQKPQ